MAVAQPPQLLQSLTKTSRIRAPLLTRLVQFDCVWKTNTPVNSSGLTGC